MNRDRQKSLVRQAVLKMVNFLRSPIADDPRQGIKAFKESEGVADLKRIYRTEGVMVDNVVSKIFSLYTSGSGEKIVYDPEDIESSFYKLTAQTRMNRLAEQPSNRIFPGAAATSPLESQKLESDTSRLSSLLPQSRSQGSFSQPSLASLYPKGTDHRQLDRSDSILPKSRYGPEDMITRPLGGFSFGDLFRRKQKPPPLSETLGGLAFDAYGNKQPFTTPHPTIPGFAAPGAAETEYQSYLRQQQNRSTEASRKTVETIGGAIGGAGKAIGEGAYATDPFDHVRSAFSALGKVLPGPVAWIAKLGEVTFGAVGAMRRWGDHLHKENMEFAKFSGGMAMVEARQNVREILLSREQGERRAGSAEKLAQARHKYAATMAPIEDAISEVKTNIWSTVMGWVSENASVKHVSTMLKRKGILEEVGRAKKDLDAGEISEEEMEAIRKDARERLDRLARGQLVDNMSPEVTKRILEQGADWPANYGRPKDFNP